MTNPILLSLTFLAIAALMGCNGNIAPGQATTVPTGRFSAQAQGTFNCSDADRENYRSIYIITDTLTGVQYLAVQGCGTSQLVTESHGKHSTTVER